MQGRWLKGILFGISLLAAGMAQAEFKEGRDYKLIQPAKPVEIPGKLEVIEFFWYACPHCRTLEPIIEAWAKKLPKDVHFRRVHVVWPGSPHVDPHARLFATLQGMGQEVKLQSAVFKAVQQDRIELRREATLLKWVQQQSINVDQFKAQYKSFNTDLTMKKLEQVTMNYGIDGVPAFVINGKYFTAPGMIGKEDATITRLMDELLAKERAASAKKKKK